jgi:hypothetical protein
MALTSEQHAEIAASYAEAATDLFISPKQREVFARKAEFFRLMAKLAAKKNAASPAGSPEHETTSKESPNTAVPKAIESFLKRNKTGASTETSPPTPAHMMALMHLALRWRLFRLETETFGRGQVKH